MVVPDWMRLELQLNHPGITIKWLPWGERKVFVLPITGDAFYRMPAKKLNGAVMYRRYLTAGTALRWQLHPQTYFPDAECVTHARWVVFQENKETGETVKLFDVVNDDGSFHPLDMRVIEAIQRRDGKFGAHDKALADVEAIPQLAETAALANLEEVTDDLFHRIAYDVKKATTDTANVKEDPEEDQILVWN